MFTKDTRARVATRSQLEISRTKHTLGVARRVLRCRGHPQRRAPCVVSPLPCVRGAGSVSAILACGASVGDAPESSNELAVSLPANNLVTNPSFEVNLSGWYAWRGTLSRVARSDAPNGNYVAKVSSTGGSTFSIGDAAPLVANIPASVSYAAAAYVRGASASSVGKPVTLDLARADEERLGRKALDIARRHVGLILPEAECFGTDAERWKRARCLRAPRERFLDRRILRRRRLGRPRIEFPGARRVGPGCRVGPGYRDARSDRRQR